MTLRDQIEARTNAANTSAVWKHLKLSERETQTSLQARNTGSERLRWNTYSSFANFYDFF